MRVESLGLRVQEGLGLRVQEGKEFKRCAEKGFGSQAFSSTPKSYLLVEVCVCLRDLLTPHLCPKP